MRALFTGNTKNRVGLVPSLEAGHLPRGPHGAATQAQIV